MNASHKYLTNKFSNDSKSTAKLLTTLIVNYM